MRVDVLDSRGRRLRARPESEEDLWALMTVLRPGDRVRGRTLRDVARGGRGAKERRPIVVTLEVKRVEFQPFTGRLRLYGVIVEGPEEYGVQGKHHSMTIAPGQEVVLERESGWPAEALRALRESGPRGRAVIAAVDYDEYSVAVLAPHGFRVAVEGHSGLPGKDSPSWEEAYRAYVSRVADAVVETASREAARVVVIVGPGDTKRQVAGMVRSRAPGLSVFVDDASMGGRAGVEEALRRPRTAQALREYAVVEAESVLEEALRRLARDPERVAFGLEEALAAARLGAVESLVMPSNLLYSIDDRERELAVELLDAARATRARVVLVPEDSPVGEKAYRLGGAVALLRYPLPREARRLSE